MGDGQGNKCLLSGTQLPFRKNGFIIFEKLPGHLRRFFSYFTEFAKILRIIVTLHGSHPRLDGCRDFSPLFSD